MVLSRTNATLCVVFCGALVLADEPAVANEPVHQPIISRQTQLLAKDQFERNSLGREWTVVRGSVLVREGELTTLHASREEGFSKARMDIGPEVQKVSLSGHVERDSADVVNLALTRRDGTPVVMVQLFKTGRLSVSAECKSVAEDLHSVAVGKSADVMIEVVGSRVAVQVNGETILDAAVRIRSIAGVSFASVGGEARLDNLQVHRLMPK